MSTILGNLGVVLSADTAALVSGLDRAAEKTRAFSQSIKSAGVVAASSFAAIAGGVTLAIKASGEQIAAERSLQAAFRATGTALDSEEFFRFAAGLQEITTTGDEAIIKLGGLLNIFGASQDEVQGLIPGILDMAAATGQSAQAITQAMGRALSGQIGSLSRYGISLTDAEKKQFKLGDGAEKAALLAKKMATFEGQAGVAASTASGRFVQFTNNLGDLLEEVGFLLEAPMAKVFEEMSGAVKGSIKFVGGLSSGFKTFLGVSAAVVTVSLGIATAILGIGFASTTAIPALLSMGAAGLTASKSMISAMAPVLIPVLAIAAAIAGVVLAVGALKQEWDADLGGMKTTITKFVQNVKFEWKELITSLTGTFGKFFDSMKEKFILLKSFFSGASPEEAAADLARSKAPKAAKVQTRPNKGPAAAGLSVSVKAIKDFALTAAKSMSKTIGGVTGSIQSLLGKFGVFGNVIDASGQSVKVFGDTTKEAVDKAVALVQAGGTISVEKSDDSLMETAKEAAVNVNTSVIFLLTSISEGLVTAASTFVSAANGSAGEAAGAFAEGFQSGGIFGAIINVFAKFLSKTKGISEMFDIMSEDLGGLLKAFEPLGKMLKNVTKNVSGSVQKVFAQLGKALGGLFKAAAPLFKAFEDISKMINGVILIILKVLTPVLKILGKVLGVIGSIISFVVKAVVKVINFVIGVIAKIVSFIPGASKAINKMKISLDSSRESVKDFGFSVRDSAEKVKSNIGKIITRFEDGSEVFQDAMNDNSAASRALTIKNTIENLKSDINGLAFKINHSSSKAFPKLNDRLRANVVQLAKLEGELVAMGGVTFKVTQAMENLSLSIDESAVAMIKQTATLSDGSKVTIDMSKTIVSQADKLQARIKELVNNMGVTEQEAATRAAKEFGVVFVDASKKAADAMDDVADTAKDVSSKLTNVPAGFKIALERFNATTGATPSASLDLGTGSLPGAVTGSAINNISGDVTNINIDTIEAMDPETLAADLNDTARFKRQAQTGTSQPSGAPFAVDRRGA